MPVIKWNHPSDSIDSLAYHHTLSENQRQLELQAAQFRDQAAFSRAQMQAAYDFSRRAYPNTAVGDALKRETRAIDCVKACYNEQEVAWALLEGYELLTGIYYARYQNLGDSNGSI